MALNRNFFQPRKDIRWNDQHACTVRGITPDDLAQIMSENAADMEVLMQTIEKDKILSKVDISKDGALQQAMQENQGRVFNLLIGSVPALIAKVIALAADDYSEEAVKHIRNEFPAPLQFEALVEIAKLTFVDQNGFKAFLGNVSGLVASVGGGKSNNSPSLPAQSDQPTSDTAG